MQNLLIALCSIIVAYGFWLGGGAKPGIFPSSSRFLEKEKYTKCELQKLKLF
jgi:hypothetical protein